MAALDQILAILKGRKVYDSTTRLWRVYDSNGVELADPSGILLRGLHGWMLQQATLLADVAHDHDTDGGGFDAPYQAYVKKITAERAAEWRRTFERKQNEERQHPPTFDGLPGEWLLPRSTVKELPKVRVAETAPSWKRMFPSAGILRPASHIDDDDAALAAMAFLALLDD